MVNLFALLGSQSSFQFYFKHALIDYLAAWLAERPEKYGSTGCSCIGRSPKEKGPRLLAVAFYKRQCTASFNRFIMIHTDLYRS